MWKDTVCTAGTFDSVQKLVADEIHKSHGATVTSTTCYLCRHDAHNVLRRLHDTGWQVSRLAS